MTCSKTNSNSIPLLLVPFDYKVWWCKMEPCCPKHSIGEPCPDKHKNEKLIPYGIDRLLVFNDMIIAKLRGTKVDLLDSYLGSLGYDISEKQVRVVSEDVKSPTSEMLTTAQEMQSVVPFKVADNSAPIITPIPKKPLTKIILDEKDNNGIINQSIDQQKKFAPTISLNSSAADDNSLFAYELFSPQVFKKSVDCND